MIEVDGVVVSIAICEDLWEPDSPPQLAAAAGADVLLVINASPFEQGKHHQRLALCQTRADQTGATVMYVAAVGGQDELVFDGGSMVVRPDGSIAVSSPRFVNHLLFCDLSVSGSAPLDPSAKPLRVGVKRAEFAPVTPTGRGFAGAGGASGGLVRWLLRSRDPFRLG